MKIVDEYLPVFFDVKECQRNIERLKKKIDFDILKTRK